MSRHQQSSERSHSWLWALPVLAVTVAVAAPGCGVDEVLNPAPTPQATRTTPVPDAGTDAAVARRLVERPLFGQMPLANRFYDPGFSRIDGLGWMPYDYSAGHLYLATRVFLPNTPLDQPALRLEKELDQAEVSVVGDAKSTAGPIEVSIWLGHPSAQDPTSDSEAALLGMFLDDTPGAWDLAVDADGEPIMLSGITWRRMSAQIPDGPVGMCYLRVASTAAGTLFLSSPILVGAGSHPAARSANIAQRRALTARETDALRAKWAFQRQRFAAKPKPRPTLRWSKRR